MDWQNASCAEIAEQTRKALGLMLAFEQHVGQYEFPEVTEEEAKESFLALLADATEKTEDAEAMIAGLLFMFRNLVPLAFNQEWLRRAIAKAVESEMRHASHE